MTELSHLVSFIRTAEHGSFSAAARSLGLTPAGVSKNVARLESDLGPQDEALRSADVEPIRAWLGERVHRHGRRLDTEPLVAHATGGAIDAEPFLRYASVAA